MRIAFVVAVVAALTIGVLALVVTDDNGANGPVVATLLVKDEYRLGEPVTMVIAVENKQKETVTLVYGPDPPYGFEVNYPPKGDIIDGAWSFSPMTSTTVRELPAGEKIEFSATWDQTDYSGAPVPPGSYLIWGSHWGRCEPDDCTVIDAASLRIVP